MPEHLEDVCLDVGPLEGGVLPLEFHDEVVAEHLLEVGLVVVHDGEVFLVEVQPGRFFLNILAKTRFAEKSRNSIVPRNSISNLLKLDL